MLGNVVILYLYVCACVCRNLEHDNLVKLYGVCTTKRPILILTEYMKHGRYQSHQRCSHCVLSNYLSFVIISMSITVTFTASLHENLHPCILKFVQRFSKVQTEPVIKRLGL